MLSRRRNYLLSDTVRHPKTPETSQRRSGNLKISPHVGVFITSQHLPTLVPVHATKVYRENGSTVPLILNLDTSWQWVVTLTPRPLYPQERIPHSPCGCFRPLPVFELQYVQPPAQPLYRLRYSRNDIHYTKWRCYWTCSLRRGSAAALLMGSRIRIPLRASMSVRCVYFVLSLVATSATGWSVIERSATRSVCVRARV